MLSASFRPTAHFANKTLFPGYLSHTSGTQYGYTSYVFIFTHKAEHTLITEVQVKHFFFVQVCVLKIQPGKKSKIILRTLGLSGIVCCTRQTCMPQFYLFVREIYTFFIVIVDF